MSAGEGPFRIAAVAELTGVAEATLRAWERRYGIPTPMRAASGYRLYAMDQVQQVKEMLRLCNEGMAVGDAAARVLSRGAERDASGAIAFGDDSAEVVIDALLDAVARFDDNALEHGLRKAMFLGTPVQIFDRLLAPLLLTIGDKWHAGELSVAQEHFATQKIGTIVRDLLRLSTGPKTVRALFGSFADDEHEIGVLGFALRVAEWGARPIVLGARTPPSAVRSAVYAVSPKLVALSISSRLSRARARELCEEYGAAAGDVPWIVGGAGAQVIADSIRASHGIVAPEDADELEALVRPLLSDGPKKRGVK